VVSTRSRPSPFAAEALRALQAAAVIRIENGGVRVLDLSALRACRAG
jgi:hypothetical protein